MVDDLPDGRGVSRERSSDPLSNDPAVADFFGPAYGAVAALHELLTAEGELRGLIGPREVPRLWERHLLNSASVVPFLPRVGRIVDVGSGAGLPGLVVAAMLPDAEVVLVEPMERRTDWLWYAADRIGLRNVDVRRGRAEEYHGAFTADAVIARAVAPLDRLCRWTLPLLNAGGVLVALKGRSVADEVDGARKVLRKLGGREPEILPAATLPTVEATTVVRIVRETVRGRASG
jgi:16S rRNA (guanine527-N7)-methyltransferase